MSQMIRALPKIALALLTSVLLVPSMPAAQAPHPDVAATQAVGAYTVFNEPTETVPDAIIEEHVIDLVNSTPPGSAIHGAMYSWTREAVAQALSNAQARGVEVHLAIDWQGSGGVNADPDSAAMQILRDAGLSALAFCSEGDSAKSACISNRDGSINHNKLFTFSATGDLTNVVVVSSQNWTTTQTRNFNNAAIIHGDPDLYAFFVGYIGNLLAQNRDNNYFNSPGGYFNSPTSRVRAYLSPRADSNGGTDSEARSDTVALRLSYVRDYEPGCAVDVAHAQFTGPRLPVVDQLTRIGRLGCQVRIVAGDGMTDYIRDRLVGQTNVSVRQMSGMHSKYIVFTGNYNGTPGRSLVFTGSHNLTGPALRLHDETLIRIERPEVSQAYRDNFSMIWARAGQ